MSHETMVYAKYRLVRQPSEQQHAAYTVGMCEIDFSFGSVFEKKTRIWFRMSSSPVPFEKNTVWKKRGSFRISYLFTIYVIAE